MIFYTCSKEPRPIRLNEHTRQFAYESLHYKYGKQTKQTPFIPLDEFGDFDSLSDIEKYDIAIREIAKKSPIRICDGEMVSGAATLGDAIMHNIPVRYKNKRVFSSVSHLTLDFDKVLKKGWNGIQDEVIKSYNIHTDPQKRRFLKSCLENIESFRIWHKRYLDELRNKPEYSKNYQNLIQVPFFPAKSFYEAVQSIWFSFAFLRLCGNWPGIGRIDVLLGDYLKKDLAEGKITLSEARKILAHFFIKGCEWICGGNYVSGDAQHYQNIVLSGIDKDGKDITNEVTYLVLDIIEETSISDFPVSVRVNSKTDDKLLVRMAEVIRHGDGVIAVYNEDLILKSLEDYGYGKDDIYMFANDGCWEVQIPGKTFFKYVPFDGLKILQKCTLNEYNANFDSFEELMNAYLSDIKNQIRLIFENNINISDNKNYPKSEWLWKKDIPCSLISMLEDDCISRAVSYLEGGCVYNVISPHIGGGADAANALYAIKKLVFDEKMISFKNFMNVLKNNWEEKEDLRQYVRNKYRFFGNDNDESDAIMVQIIDSFALMCSEYENKSPYYFPSGVSTFGRQIEWISDRLAAAHGFRKGEILSGNCSPTPGTDFEGATAIIRSYSKINLAKQVTGAALDLSLMPNYADGENGISSLVGLIKGFVSLGGYFMQINIVDKDTLLDAQKHPENYKTLSVRVSGWSARFVTLSKEWQDMIIERS